MSPVSVALAQGSHVSWNVMEFESCLECHGICKKFAVCHGMSWKMKIMELVLQNLLECTICFLDLRNLSGAKPQECYKCHGNLRFLSWNVMEFQYEIFVGTLLAGSMPVHVYL